MRTSRKFRISSKRRTSSKSITSLFAGLITPNKSKFSSIASPVVNNINGEVKMFWNFPAKITPRRFIVVHLRTLHVSTDLVILENAFSNCPAMHFRGAIIDTKPSNFAEHLIDNRILGHAEPT